jgi:hypothetical protein
MDHIYPEYVDLKKLRAWMRFSLLILASVFLRPHALLPAMQIEV